MTCYQKIIELYSKENLNIIKSSYGPYHLIDGFFTGGGITELEILYFEKYKDVFINPKIFIIGNAFGFSTIAFSQIFKNASIDVIDAEVEGTENKKGSEITKKIADFNNLDINLTIGFSPKDTKSAMRFDSYDIVFIDGLHTNEQLILDFDSIKSFLNKNKFICFFHDIKLFKLETSFNYIKDNNKNLYDDYIVSLDEKTSESGMGILSKNISIIK